MSGRSRMATSASSPPAPLRAGSTPTVLKAWRRCKIACARTRIGSAASPRRWRRSSINCLRHIRSCAPCTSSPKRTRPWARRATLAPVRAPSTVMSQKNARRSNCSTRLVPTSAAPLKQRIRARSGSRTSCMARVFTRAAKTVASARCQPTCSGSLTTTHGSACMGAFTSARGSMRSVPDWRRRSKRAASPRSSTWTTAWSSAAPSCA